METSGAGIESKEGKEGAKDSKRDEDVAEVEKQLREEIDGDELEETLRPEGTSCGIELRKVDCSF